MTAVKSILLPKKCNHPRGVHAAAQYEKMGIKLQKSTDAYLKGTLPKGWSWAKIEGNLWATIYDDQDRFRAIIYDNGNDDSFVIFRTRYHINYYRNQFEIKDSDKVIEVFRDEDTARDWLGANYPSWKDLNAYWNE